MGKLFDSIEPKLADWIGRQRLFFVATAPDEGGHVNVSPKGPIGTLRVVGERTVEYDDHVGSGAETAAHLRENGRICLMLCAFEGPPRIVRLHGHGTVIPAGDPSENGTRAVVRIEVERISDSCGFGVPLMDYVADRDSYARYTDHKTDEEIEEYRVTRNAASIDGLPAWDPLTV